MFIAQRMIVVLTLSRSDPLGPKLPGQPQPLSRWVLSPLVLSCCGALVLSPLGLSPLRRASALPGSLSFIDMPPGFSPGSLSFIDMPPGSLSFIDMPPRSAS